MSTYRSGEGASVALLMLELRDLKTDLERMCLLWARIADPKAGEAMLEFCIDELVKIKSDQVYPYLVAVATMDPLRSWYAPRRAVARLADFYPQSGPLLEVLSKSSDKTLAGIAEDNLHNKVAPIVIPGFPNP